jgi:hypothetical protein
MRSGGPAAPVAAPTEADAPPTTLDVPLFRDGLPRDAASAAGPSYAETPPPPAAAVRPTPVPAAARVSRPSDADPRPERPHPLGVAVLAILAFATLLTIALLVYLRYAGGG